MSSKRLVSVIVPTRNSARTLHSCLTSIRAQSYQPIELIVVDNHSTDETMLIAARHADAVEQFGPERSSQRNHGAHLANGDYFLFVDSDMELAPQIVSDCLDAIRSSAAPGVVIPEVTTGEGFVASCRAFERSCYVGDDSIESARFFTRAAFTASGGFDEHLVAFEDRDLSLRIGAGNRLPRIATFISHDEGRLRLRTILNKKRYYAASFMYYRRKHGRATFSQANLVFRPAFVRNWRRLVSHPGLAAGMLSLKALEGIAVTLGLLEVWVRRLANRRRPLST